MGYSSKYNRTEHSQLVLQVDWILPLVMTGSYFPSLCMCGLWIELSFFCLESNLRRCTVSWIWPANAL